MFDKDNIRRTKVLQAVEKVPTDEKMIANASVCVLLCIATAYKEHTNI